ncbi:hypothetical protein [Desulfothermobacter acidiphilus]|uniref:hypothetical protein n=1 Tax=Desulfothermobacter acidiphilus TaxID=1938353 RepID=UPI003F899BF8
MKKSKVLDLEAARAAKEKPQGLGVDIEEILLKVCGDRLVPVHEKYTRMIAEEARKRYPGDWKKQRAFVNGVFWGLDIAREFGEDVHRALLENTDVVQKLVSEALDGLEKT